MRSRAMHEQWLSQRTCTVLCLDGRRPVDELVGEVLGLGTQARDLFAWAETRR